MTCSWGPVHYDKKIDELYERLTDRLKLNFIIGLMITILVAVIVCIILKKYYPNLERLVRYDTLTGALNRPEKTDAKTC